MQSYREIKAPQNPRHTLFIPWTRYEYADKMLDNINGLALPREATEVVFYVDTDDKRLWKRLDDWAVLNQFVYNGITLVRSNNKAPENFSPIPRRERIVRMKEASKDFIKSSDYVFAIEDDTRVPMNAFDILHQHFIDDKDKTLGFAQGVQMGRWGMNVLGAWKLDDVHNPSFIETLPFEGDVVEIDGGGMFCYMTPSDLYRDTQYYFWAAEPGGPDATYGFELRKKGLRCLMDFRLVCDHYTEQGILVPTPHNIITMQWKLQDGMWKRQKDLDEVGIS